MYTSYLLHITHTVCILMMVILLISELVRSKCMVEQVHVKIVKLMMVYMNIQLFQEVALETIAILAAAGEGSGGSGEMLQWSLCTARQLSVVSATKSVQG